VKNVSIVCPPRVPASGRRYRPPAVKCAPFDRRSQAIENTPQKFFAKFADDFHDSAHNVCMSRITASAQKSGQGTRVRPAHIPRSTVNGSRFPIPATPSTPFPGIFLANRFGISTNSEKPWCQMAPNVHKKGRFWDVS
jgi:hypothetical protein